MTASSVMPVSMMLSRGSERSMTIRAPVRVLDMANAALVSSPTVVSLKLSSVSGLDFVGERSLTPKISALPIVSSALRSSGWNITIRDVTAMVASLPMIHRIVSNCSTPHINTKIPITSMPLSSI